MDTQTSAEVMSLLTELNDQGTTRGDCDAPSRDCRANPADTHVQDGLLQREEALHTAYSLVISISEKSNISQAIRLKTHAFRFLLYLESGLFPVRS